MRRCGPELYTQNNKGQSIFQKLTPRLQSLGEPVGVIPETQKSERLLKSQSLERRVKEVQVLDPSITDHWKEAAIGVFRQH